MDEASRPPTIAPTTKPTRASAPRRIPAGPRELPAAQRECHHDPVHPGHEPLGYWLHGRRRATGVHRPLQRRLERARRRRDRRPCTPTTRSSRTTSPATSTSAGTQIGSAIRGIFSVFPDLNFEARPPVHPRGPRRPGVDRPAAPTKGTMTRGGIKVEPTGPAGRVPGHGRDPDPRRPGRAQGRLFGLDHAPAAARP